MKKLYHYIIVIFITTFIFFLSNTAFTQNVSIGNDSIVNQHIPIEPYYGYTYSQIIYPQTSIEISGTIFSIIFEYSGSIWTDSINVYMGTTEKDTFENHTDWISISALNPVFSGFVSTSQNMMKIVFDSPFYYSNVSNLVIAIDENTTGWHLNTDEFLCSPSNIGAQSIYYYSDNTNPNPDLPPDGNLVEYFANVQLSFDPEYCYSQANSSVDSEIDEVVFNTLSNNTAGICATYSDFTYMVTDLFPLNEYNLNITIGTCGGNYNKGGKVFIDWNGNGNFYDQNEEVAILELVNPTTTYNKNIEVPVSAISDSLRMRIVVAEIGGNANFNSVSEISPCGNYSWGETEDYTLYIHSPSSNDAGVSALEDLPMFTGNSDILISLKNYGLSTLNSATINWSADGNIGVPFYWNGNLSAGNQEDSINIGSYNFNSISHNIQIWTSSPNGISDENLLNDTLSEILNFIIIDEINNFPFTESFETGIGNFLQSSEDDFDWTLNSGTTPSLNTGPDTAFSGNFYFYTESSSPRIFGDEASLLTLCDFSLLSSPQISFNYHMLGAGMGILHIDINDDVWTNDVWNISGSQGSSWEFAEIDLSNYAGIDNLIIRFRATIGDGVNETWQSDISIDNIKIVDNIALDVGITAILNPLEIEIVDDIIPVEIVITNFGTDTVSSILLKYQVNNGTIVSQNWTGILASLDSDTITMPNLVIPGGFNTICASAEMLGDSAFYNNEFCKDFFAQPHYDAELLSIEFPSSGCGLGQENTIIKIRNNGEEINGGFIAGMSIDGAPAIIEPITAIVLPGEIYYHTFSTSIDLSTISEIDFEITTFIFLANDPIFQNDTLQKTITSYLNPTAPSASNYNIFSGQTATIELLPNDPEISHLWYSGIDTSFLQITNIFETPILLSTTEYFVQASRTFPNILSTIFSANNDHHGNMFDISIINSIIINGFDLNIDAGETTIEIYYKAGTYLGFETDATAWTFLESQAITGLGTDVPAHIDISNLFLNAGETYALYISSTNSIEMNYTTLSSLETFADENLQITTGAGKEYPFGQTFSPRRWNGTIYYTSLNNCQSNLVCDTVFVSVPTNDLSIVAANSPTTGYNLTNSEMVNVEIANFASNPASNFIVIYSINDTIIVSETVSDTILPMDTLDFYFSTIADLSVNQVYNFSIYTSLPGDQINNNDTLSFTAENILYLPGETCEIPYILNLPVINFQGTTENYGDDFENLDCGGTWLNGDDIVYEFVVSDSGALSGSVVGDWAGMVILDDCPENYYNCISSAYGYNGGSFENIAVFPGTYYAIVSSYPAPQSTDFILNLTLDTDSIIFGCTNPIAFNYNPNANVDDGNCWITEAGESCSNSFIYGNVNEPAVSNSISPYYLWWYSFTVDGIYSNVVVSLCGSNYDTQLQIWENCSDSNYIAHNDDFCLLQSEIVFDTLFAGTYYVKVYGYNNSSGDFTLSITGDTISIDVLGCTDSSADNYNPNATIDDGSCTYTNIVPWFFANTGIIHNIIIPETAALTIDGNQISIGDYIGVFYDSLGFLACGGFSMWAGTSIVLPTYGESLGNDGYSQNEEFKWKIWTPNNNMEYDAQATYNTNNYPNSNTFATNGLSGLEELLAFSYQTQSVQIDSGWNLFSTYIDPFEPTLDSIFGNILQELEIIKDQFGLVFWPQFNVNSIGNHIIGRGYQIKMNATTSTIIIGNAVEPQNTPISLNQGWSIVGYLRQSEASISLMFNSIATNIHIAKDENGEVYWPIYSINNIGNMKPGEAYQIKMINSSILVYPN